MTPAKEKDANKLSSNAQENLFNNIFFIISSSKSDISNDPHSRK
jgi:hypothetical protein